MEAAILTIILLAALAVACLLLWRWSDRRAERKVAAMLVATQPAEPPRFDPKMVRDLPDAARRYFAFTIRPGTPLHRVADIRMSGRFSLGTKDKPGYMPMQAHQVLAAPTGFIWSMTAAKGAMRFSGSDAAISGTSWTRFWLLSIVPVARLGRTPDHRRSAFGRYIAEAAFWTPAALLPAPGIAWQEAGPATARVTVTHDGLEQSVDLSIDADGRPVALSFLRWSDANPEKRYRLQPFGGFLSDYRDFNGFRLPTRIEAGNQFGTDEYFPFFIAEVEGIGFPGGGREPELSRAPIL